MSSLHVKIDFGNGLQDVGKLLLSEKLGRYVFSYDTGFIGSDLEISPFTLPLGADSFVAEKNSDLYDLHGVFADSLPDAWGKKVQDAEFAKIALDEPTALDRLAFVGKFGIGALRFEPSGEFEQGKQIVTLAQLRKATQKILAGDFEDVAEELLHCGGSAGGARPKFLVDLDIKTHSKIRYTAGVRDEEMVPVILKVPLRSGDHYQRIEYVYSVMGAKAGLEIPEVYLLTGGKSKSAFFAIERFDVLKTGERLHTHTLAGLQGWNFREVSSDYRELLRITGELTRNHRDVVEVYKRMVFNYLGCNKDDHAKNFSFTMNKKGTWSLSPAYDIGYSSGENGLHAMAINGLRRNATSDDFRRIADDFDIREWKSIVAQTVEALNTWKSLAAEFGVTDRYVRMIQERIKENITRLGKKP